MSLIHHFLLFVSVAISKMKRVANDDRGRVEYLDTPVKSENDKKEYRVIRLQNGLTALLIADIQVHSSSSQDDVQNKTTEENKIENDKSNESGKVDEREGKDDKKENKEAASNEKHYSEPFKGKEKMAACSLCVGVGSFSDPPEIAGMAHFLEHMIFMGSEKYPQENEVLSFIEKHGGFFNAWTSGEHTVFYFDVQEKYLLPTLDRFAQIFIKPLIKKDAIIREREAVESEFQLYATNEVIRKLQLFNTFVRTGHPAKKFFYGNLVTLRDNVNDDELYKELHRFRKRHYSAHRMNLSIQARLPLDTLEKYVTMYFTDIPNNGLPPDDFTEFKNGISFDTPAFRRMYKMKSVLDVTQLHLSWALPSLLDDYKSIPHKYISWIFAHEGKGSLFSYLRKKLWATNIYSGDYDCDYENNSMFTILKIVIVLSNEGQKHLEEVLDAIFSFINLMKKEGPQKRIYDEMSQLAENNFRFISENQPIDYVQHMAESMYLYPSRDYITGSKLYLEYNPKGIRNCIDYLVPENVNIIIIDKKFNDEELDKIGPWPELYNCKLNYSDIEIPPEWIERWRIIEPLADFNLPLPNVFLTSDFSLIPISPDVPMYPVKIYADSISEIWYRPDPKFARVLHYSPTYLPCSTYVSEKASNAMIYVTYLILMDIFIDVLQLMLSEELYPAIMAKIYYAISVVAKGIEISISGFNEKQPLVLMAIAKYIAEYSNHATRKMFEVLKEQQIRNYYNTFLKPDNLADDAISTILELVSWTNIDLHAALSDVDFEEFQNFVKFFTHHLYVQCLVQGNMRQDAVIENIQQFIETLNSKPLLANTMPQERVTQIPLGIHCCKLKNFHESDMNSVISNYYQIGVDSIELSVLIDLLILIMQEPLFNKLRTLEQLGYNVNCYRSNVYGIVGYIIAIHTRADTYTTEHVDERIEEFLKSFNKTIENMPDEELENFKVALIKMKQCADIDLYEEFNRNWNEVKLMEYIFDRIERQILAIKCIKIDELRKWIAKHTLDENNLRKLSMRVVGTTLKESTSIKNEVTNDWKRNKNADVAENRGKTYSLEYIIDEQQSKEMQENRITDIEDYKRRLYVYPVSAGINPRALSN